MIDRFGRKIEYLRISVTDRCNLRCRYCMPASGVERMEHSEILTFDEILRLAKIFIRVGITKVKITGGEPLVRKNVTELIKELKALDGMEEVTLTTNGVLLEQFLPELLTAGLDGVNISIDTLNEKKYEEITGFNELSSVLKAIRACLLAGGLKVKLNAVTLDKCNRAEIADLAGLARDNQLDVRFIEMMPLGMGKDFHGYSRDEILDVLTEKYGPAKLSSGKEQQRGNGPAVYYDLKGFKGKIGFVSAVSHSFCESCNRVRLTSGGFLKPCLNYAGGADLKKLLRNGTAEEKIEAVIEETIRQKPEKHGFFTEDEYKEQKLMSDIGG